MNAVKGVLRLALAVGLCLSTTAPSAAGLSASQFLDGCKAMNAPSRTGQLSKDVEIAALVCVAYVTGLMEGIGLKTHYPSRICIPMNTLRDEGFSRIVTQMQVDRADRRYQEVAVAAAAGAYPCK